MRKINLLFYTIFLVGSLASCRSTVPVNTQQNNIAQTRQLNDIALNGKVYSAVWQQNAGEFRALCYQAYNFATLRVDEELAKKHEKPMAIITDVDETFLDNSPYALEQTLIGEEFDMDSWVKWAEKGEAYPFAGSLEFFNYAASKGISIFYITNRSMPEKDGTLKNLRELGYPFADEGHLMLMGATSDKEERRLNVLKNYEVILYMGDNLGDFSKVFYKQSQDVRNARVDELHKEFGKKFIVLPNSGYGDWESVLPGYKANNSVREKDTAILKNVRGYIRKN